MSGLPPFHLQRLLGKYDLRPKKGLGQNFLLDEDVLEKIVDISGIGSSELASSAEVLEVGPGPGCLTRHLAARAERVVAVELDRRFLPLLAEALASWSNVTVVQGDILAFSPQNYFEQAYTVAANIPYYITSAVIRHLLEAPVKPRRMVMTVQKEVAERICASAGNLSLLALGVQVYGSAEYLFTVPAAAFFPQPNVDSAVLRIDLFSQPLITPDRLDRFFALAKAGFGQKRKTLRNALSSNLHLNAAETALKLTAADIDPMRRAETLTIPEWDRLLDAFGK